jgi:hypothetical protein
VAAEPTPEVAPTATRTPPPPGPPRWLVATWLTVALAGVAALMVTVFEAGPGWLDGVGATAVVTSLAWLLAARTGSRALVGALLTLTLAVAAVVVGGRILPTGASVLTCALGGVCAVMMTVPAQSFLKVVREVLVATLIAGVTAVAAVGFEPTVNTERFDIAALVLALVFSMGVIYRLGAGLHGLGRRGLLVVAVGIAVLVATLAYAEVLQRYGAQGFVSSVLDFVDATEERIGAFPRPLVALLGIPALAWGVHMRTRRRQGWWVSAFGVAATVPLATALVDPGATFLEASLRAGYSLAIGLPVAFVVIKADAFLSRPRGRRAEDVEQLRPEPARFEEL